METTLRNRLIAIALEWQNKYGVAPAITSTLSEYDAAILVKCPEDVYANCMSSRTAVSKGYDFIFKGDRYQVKANRPSGKPGSPVTLVGKANNYDWDYLIWILYDTKYNIVEAWQWDVESYEKSFDRQTRLSPTDMRKGKRLA